MTYTIYGENVINTKDLFKHVLVLMQLNTTLYEKGLVHTALNKYMNMYILNQTMLYLNYYFGV